MKRLLPLLIAVAVLGCSDEEVSEDDRIRDIMIAESIASYEGNCPCPYNRDSAGNRCGGRSAYSRSGGASPLCYRSDISDEEVEAYRQSHDLAPGWTPGPTGLQPSSMPRMRKQVRSNATDELARVCRPDQLDSRPTKAPQPQLPRVDAPEGLQNESERGIPDENSASADSSPCHGGVLDGPHVACRLRPGMDRTGEFYLSYFCACPSAGNRSGDAIPGHGWRWTN